jgi:outer membrane protein assembly factor BamB
MKRSARRLTAALFLCATSLALPAIAQVPEGAAHIHWLQRDNAFYTGLGLVEANAQSAPDVVVAGGDRGSYTGCPGTGYPGFLLHQVKDRALIPAAKLAVLDGATGDPVWEVVWRPGGDAADPPVREAYHLVSGVQTGDLDGDGSGDLVVLRTVMPAGGSEYTQHVTSYDPRTGMVEWNVTNTVPAGQLSMLSLAPMSLSGSPAALLTQLTVKVTFDGAIDITIEGINQVVGLEPGKAPKKVVDLPNDLGVALPVPYGEGYRFISFPIRITGPPPAISIGARAVDLTIGSNGQPKLEEAWSRPGAGGSPWHITGGSDPAVVVGRPTGTGTEGQLVAIDLDTGQDRWVSELNVGPGGGALTAADVNADGVQDVIASPAFGNDPTGLFNGGFFGEIHALNGATGQALWTKTDRVSKFRAWSLELIDVDGAGGPEIVGGMASQDGFPTCSAPNDDSGMVSVWNLSDGQQRCRLHTDRFPSNLVGADLNTSPGQEIVAPTYGGNVYAFTNAQPGCGVLGTNPL